MPRQTAIRLPWSACDVTVDVRFDVVRKRYKGVTVRVRLQKGRKLVEKLHAAQDEARALEAQLQARDEALAQAAMHAQAAAELRDTCGRLQAHIQQLEATVEDLVTSAATLAKVRRLSHS